MAGAQISAGAGRLICGRGGGKEGRKRGEERRGKRGTGLGVREGGQKGKKKERKMGSIRRRCVRGEVFKGKEPQGYQQRY